MSPDEHINRSLRKILRAGGIFRSSLTDQQHQAMRDEIRKIMSEAYITGSNNCFRVIKNRGGF